MTRTHDCRAHWGREGTENRDDRKRELKLGFCLGLPPPARICRLVSFVWLAVPSPPTFRALVAFPTDHMSPILLHSLDLHVKIQGLCSIRKKKKNCLSLAKQRLIAFVPGISHSIAVRELHTMHRPTFLLNHHRNEFLWGFEAE